MKRSLLVFLSVIMLLLVLVGCGSEKNTNIDKLEQKEEVLETNVELLEKGKLGISVPSDTLLVGIGRNSKSPLTSCIVISTSGSATLYSATSTDLKNNNFGSPIDTFTLRNINTLKGAISKIGLFSEPTVPSSTIDSVTYYIYTSKCPEGIDINYMGEIGKYLLEKIELLEYDGISITSLLLVQ